MDKKIIQLDMNKGFEPLILLPSTSIVDNVWLQVFRSIYSMSGDGSEFSLVIANHRKLILAEVIKLRWDSKFKIKGVPKPLQAQLKIVGELTNNLLNLIDEVFLLEPCGYPHPAIWFREVFLENEAIGIYTKTEGDAEKAAYMSEFGNANQQLWTLASNPFTKPNTKALFDLALEMAERYDRFTPHLRAFTRSRRKLATYLRKNTELLNKSPTGSKIIARQGRKKKKKSKVDSETLAGKEFQRK